MKLTIALVVAALIITAAVVVSSTPDQTAEAKSVRKVHFTETVQSSSDPGKGNKGQQMAVLLSPNPGTIYVGTVTYTASIPIKIMINLHTSHTLLWYHFVLLPILHDQSCDHDVQVPLLL